MKNLSKKVIQKLASGLFLVVLSSMFLFSSCSKEDLQKAKQKVSFEATDAPIDNAEVSAVFVTISELHVNGEKLDGFQKTTLELSALTSGKTALLQDVEMDASSISKVEVVLDYEMDASGASPGAYIKKADGTKDALMSSANKIEITKTIELASSSTTNIVLDFDLRKMVKQEASGNYELVSGSELNAAVRAVAKSKAGTVQGNISNMSTFSGNAVAYIYKKGEYNANTEASGSGESNVEFSNAINSAKVNSSGNFVLSFIEEGEYEIHIIEYKDTNNDGKLEIEGEAECTTSGTLQLGGFNVEANSTTNLNLQVNGIFKF